VSRAAAELIARNARSQRVSEPRNVQKLEPLRTTLSAKPVSPSIASLPAAAPAQARKCTNCGTEDRAEVIQGEYDAHGNQKIEHFVTIELRYLKVKTEAEAHKLISPYLRRKGWSYKLFQTRHAMQRFICRPCLRELSVMERDWDRKSKKDGAPSNLSSYYGALCGD
jgi:hypothetical protein